MAKLRHSIPPDTKSESSDASPLHEGPPPRGVPPGSPKWDRWRTIRRARIRRELAEGKDPRRVLHGRWP